MQSSLYQYYELIMSQSSLRNIYYESTIEAKVSSLFLSMLSSQTKAHNISVKN